MRLRLLAVVLLMFLGACSGGASSARPGTPITTTPRIVVSLPPAGFLSAPASGDRHTVVEWGWDGTRLRAVHVEAVVDCCTTVFLSPDGTRLLVLGAGNGGEILDLTGHVIARGPDVAGQWADDSRHLCLLRPHSHGTGMPQGRADLVLVDPGRDARVIAQVAGYGPHSEPTMLRCSITDDVALVAQNAFARNRDVSAVRLSAGTVATPSWAHRSGAGEVVAVSGNGRFALEYGSSGGTQTDVVDTTTGKVVAHTDGQAGDLSWDGHVVLESDSASLRLRAVDWRTHITRWLSIAPPLGGPWPAVSYAFAARRNTDDLALAVTNQPRQPYGQAELWLLNGHASTRLARAVRFGII